MRSIYSAALVVVLAVAAPATAATITQGFTFTVADSGGNLAGNHFHSNTGGSFGNAAGQAEVGGLGGEVIRGLSEYNLTGLSAATSAFVTFTISREGGLFSQSPFTGPITVVAYQGNNTEDLSDFQATALATIGTFTLSPTTNDVGNVFSLDITSVFNSFIARNSNSLGIRLQGNGSNQAWTFNQFRLTTDNQATGGVPEPATWAMMLLGFGGMGYAMRRRTKVSTRVRFV